MNNFSIIQILILATALCSCKKSYECSCTVFEQNLLYTFDDVKSKEAEEACTKMNDFYADEEGSCVLTEEEN